MSATMLADPTQAMSQHQGRLKAYARRVINCGERLCPEEEIDRGWRVKEFLALGGAFGCTEKELIKLLYSGILQGKRGCDCFNCQPLHRGEDGPAP